MMQEREFTSEEEYLLARAALILANDEMRYFESLPEATVPLDKKKLETKIFALLEKEERKSIRLKKSRKAKKYFSRIAVVFLAVLISFSLAFTSVEAFRIRILNFIYDSTDLYTEFRLVDASDDNSGESALPTPADEALLPGFVPGYLQLSDIDKSDMMTMLQYEGSGDQIMLIEIMTGEVSMKVDTEDSEYTVQEVAGIKIHTYIKESRDKKTLVWSNDNTMYLIIGTQMPLEDLTAVAESMIAE